VAVAARIRDGLRSSDIAARLGGDEFGVLLLDIPDASYASTVAARLLAEISTPLDVAGVPVEVNASIGVAVDTEAMHGVDDLLSDADVAMYQAKALGKRRLHVFDGNPEGRVAAERPWSDDQRTVRRPALGPARLEPGAG
jgi:diguanylate cyclase (GGDEF)-like protein